MVGDWRDYVAGSGGTNAEDALVGVGVRRRGYGWFDEVC